MGNTNKKGEEKPEGFNLPSSRHFPKENFLEFNTDENGKEIKLHTYLYEPPATLKPRGMIYILHGMDGYVGEYEQLASQLTGDGYICTGFDLKGYGQSEGYRAYFNNFDDWMRDVVRFINVTTAIFPGGIPKYILGSSLGGSLAIYIAINHPQLVNGIITFMPALVRPPDFKPTLIKIMTKYGWMFKIIGKLPFLSKELEKYTKDKNLIYQIENDPFVYQGKMRVSGALAILKLIEWMSTEIRHLSTPMTVWIGDKDETVSVIGLKNLFANIPDPQLVQMNIIPNVRHDFLFNKEAREFAVESILNWLKHQSKA